MEVKSRLDMEHGFMQSIIRNQVDRLITSVFLVLLFSLMFIFDNASCVVTSK